MRKFFLPLAAAFCFLLLSNAANSQNNLAAGDIAIVSYQSDFDPDNPIVGDNDLAEFEDRFSIVVTKPGGLAAGTLIYFTTRGWDATTGTWHDFDFTPTFGLGRRAVVEWIVPAGGIARGTEIFFRNRYHDEVAVGSEYYDWSAYADEAGTTFINNLTNVTPIVPAANSTDGMGFTFGGDHLIVYQTGPVGGPAGGPNATPIRFITALMANNSGTTTYAAWDPVPNPAVNNESSLPPGLTNGTTAFLMSPGPLPAPSDGITEPDNGKFSNCASSSAGTVCSALQMSTLIYTTTSWTYQNSVFADGASSSLCTYTFGVLNVTNPVVSSGTVGTPFNQTFNATGGTGGPYTFTTGSPLPAGLTLSAAGVLSGTPTVSGSFPIVVTATDANTCAGNGATYSLVIAACGQAGVMFSEIHYDNASTDANERIEVFGPAGTDLTGWTIVLYNGSNSQTYTPLKTLSGTIPNQCTIAGNNYGTVVVTYAVDELQNGAPDGMALVNASNVVVEFISYEGVITATNGPANGMTSVNIIATEPGTAGNTDQGSIQRTSTGNTWTTSGTVNTFGACNTGFVVNTADINLQGNATNIADGDITPVAADHTDFGNQSVCTGSLVRTFTIQNTGGAPLTLAAGSITITGADAAMFTVGGITLPASVAAAGSTTFTVSFNPSSLGLKTATVNILSNDCDENPYDFAIQGTGVDPEINVQGNAANIPDGSVAPIVTNHTYFVGVDACGVNTVVRTFTIQNSGNSNLTIGAITMSGADAPMFTVGLLTPASPIAPAGTATFTVTFDPTSVGSKTATVNIVNGDCDENPYDFAVEGVGTDPDINVTGNGNTIPDGDVTPTLTDHTDFGSQSVCAGSITRTYTIQNTGNSNLGLTSIIISGTHAGDYNITANATTPVTPAGSTSFNITFNPSASGTRTATITINNSDCDEAAYDFAVQGTGIDPEINIQGNGNTIVDGDVTPSLADHTDFDQMVLTNNLSRTYTIQNTGDADLTIGAGAITITGADAAMFTVGGIVLPATIVSGGSATFTVTFTPTSIGPKTATVNIANNDCDENLYSFAIQGTGTACSITLSSAAGTDAQIVCLNSTITPITYSTAGATGATFTNLPPGVNGAWAANVVTINGAPNTTVGSPFNYTVTLTGGGCGAITATGTITVAPLPTITSVVNDDVCAPGGVVNLSAASGGTINWYDAAGAGGIVVNTGTTYSPNISSTTTYYLESFSPSGTQNLLAMPAQSSTFPGNVRGYWFTAPTDFVITSLSVPTTASSAGQSIAVVKFNGNTPPPVFSSTTNAFTTEFLTRDNAVAGSIPCNIPVLAGEVIGFLGYRGNINSYAPGDYNTTIAGFPIQLQRLGMQHQLTTTNPQNIWREFGAATSISRIEFEYSTSQSCTSAPRTPVTGTVKPTPVITATPSAQTICSGSAITTIVLGSNEPGTTYTWSRDNTGTVTGIAANGTTDISGTLTNTTNAPVTVTFTITSDFNGCPGVTITATVIVNPIPNAVATPATQTICSGSNITTIVLSGNVAGTVYDWTRNSPVVTGIAASGSGDISGGLTNATFGPITVTFTITPSYTNAGTTCTGTPITATVVVNPIPAMAQPASQVVCNNTATAPVIFTGSVPGTVYSWTNNTTSIGLAANGTGDIASFTATNITNAPVTATIVVTPSYTNAGATCTGAQRTFLITVNPTPTVNVVANQVVCNNTATAAVNFTGAVAGTVYNWTNNTTSIGLAASGAGDIASFTATNATNAPIVATIVVTPSYTNGGTTCTGTPRTFTITVNPSPSITITTPNPSACAGFTLAHLYYSGTTNGANQYSIDYNVAANGAGFVDVGFTALPGSPIALAVPAAAPPAVYNGSLTVRNSTTGCISAIYPITVTAGVCTPSITDPCTCLNNATTLTNGQFQETVQINGPAGQTWTVTAVSGLYTVGSPAPPAAPIPVTVGTVFTEGPPGTYTLSGKHIDAIGYTISVSNGLGTTLSIGNTCEYPNPAITGLLPVYCANDPAVTLTGTPGDANIISQGFTVNGNPATQFNPAALGAGTHTVVYTVNGGVPKAFGPGDPGCIQSVSQSVIVNPVPNAVATPAAQTICSGAITPIVLTGNVAGTVYNWTRDNVATVTGIPAAGTGNISGSLNNTTGSAVTVTFTITPSYTNAGVTCTGTPITATVLVNPLVDGTIIAGTVSICAGQSATVNVNLTGTPNFTGHFRISVFNGVGTATPDFVWTATVDGPSSVAIPAANLTNTSNGTTTYRVSWVTPNAPSLVDANNCPLIAPLTGVRDIIVYPVPNITATRVNPAGDICPGTAIVFNVANPNGVLNSLFNWTAVGANAVTYGSGTNVAFGNGAVNTTLGLSCPVPAGANPITFTFTPVGPGPLGCVGTLVTSVVNVQDVTPPSLTSGNGSGTFECSDAAGIAAARAFVPTFSNTNCPSATPVLNTPTEVYTPSCGYTTPYAAGETGTLVTTWLATEPCGQTTSVTQTITIVDTGIPTWTTAVGTLNTTIECTNDAAAFAIQLAAAQAFVPIPTDLCTPLATLTANRVKVAGTFAQSNPGTCITAGTYTNTFTTTDACGNASIIYTQVITIVDNTSPTLGDPGPQTLNVGAGANCQVPLPDYRGMVTYTDCTPILSSVQSPAPGTLIVGGPGPGPVGGSQVVTITVTDGCGNVSVRNITVNLTDATPPIARCHDMTVTLSAAGAGSLTPAQLDGNKSGVAGNGPTTPAINPWILSSDACGLGTVLFNPANTGVGGQFPSGSGNTTTLRNFNCSHLTNLVGTIPLTIRVTDPSGNFTDCISNITVLDVTPPAITCVAPVTLQKNATCVTILPSFVGIGQTTATDACGPITFTQIPAAGSIIAADVASLAVQFIAVDGSGNSSTCSTTIQFRDQTPPVISGCPANITVTTGVGNTDCQVVVNWTPPTVTDNCSPILGITTLTSTHLPAGPGTFSYPGGGFQLIPDDGTTTQTTLNVTGVPAGSTVQSVVINGIQHTFPADIDAALTSPLGTSVILMSDIGGSIDMTGESITLRDGFPALTTGLNGTGIYSPTNIGATDNFPAPGPGSLTQAAPALANFGSGNMNGTWTLNITDDLGGDFGSINNWGIIFFNPAVGGTPFFVGTTPVTYTATDAAGNTSTCTFTVTVIDNTLPTITCTTPGDKTVNANTGGCSYTHAGAAWDATGTDNCIPVTSIFYTLTGATTATGTNGQSLNGRVFNSGTTVVTWTIVDQYTNSTTCSFNVIVTDTQGPTLTCPANVTINANAAGCRGTVPGSSMIPVANDNCGITLVEWSVSGATPASSGLGNIGTFTFNIGNSLVTYRVSDAAGNSTLCSFTVTVNNAVAGAISGTSTVAQNIATTSTITFTGSGAPAGANYTFTYNVNGGATQTVSTTGGSNVVTVAQSNAVLGTFTYTLLTVTDNITGCPGAVTAPNTAVVTVVNGTPDLTASQLFTTTQVAAGGTIDEVVVIRNVGTTATTAPIVFTVSTYSALTGLTVSSNGNPSVTIGFTTFTLNNSQWTFNAATGTFTSNAGVFLAAGGTANIGVRIVRGTPPNQGANGTVNQTVTITNGTGGGETPTNNNTINNSLLKN